MKNKTALVLGAGGFIGNHLVNRLKSEGYWVRGVDLKYPEFSLVQRATKFENATDMAFDMIVESIEHILCSGCPTCEGRGSVKTVETVCFEILREITRVNRAYDADNFVVYASPFVAEALLGDESHALAELEVFIGKQVRVQAEPLYIQEQFDVVMM